MKLSIHPGAEQDIADAIDFYKEHAGPRVAAAFLNEFNRVATLLLERPRLSAAISKGRRVFATRVFPYSVVFSCISGITRRYANHCRASSAQKA